MFSWIYIQNTFHKLTNTGLQYILKTDLGCQNFMTREVTICSEAEVCVKVEPACKSMTLALETKEDGRKKVTHVYSDLWQPSWWWILQRFLPTQSVETRGRNGGGSRSGKENMTGWVGWVGFNETESSTTFEVGAWGSRHARDKNSDFLQRMSFAFILKYI